MRIQLVVPALEGFKYTRKSGCPPLGLASIASYLMQQGNNPVEVEILDGEVIADNNVIISCLHEGALVGILTKTPNYPGAVKIAKSAKEKQCVVVMGGVYATHMADVIIRHRPEVDFVVRGFGEKPMQHIISLLSEGASFPQDRILTELIPCFNDFPHPSRQFFDMESYVKNFSVDRPTWAPLRGTNIFTHMGCMHNCDFCSRMWPAKGVYWRNPTAIWDEIAELVSEYGIDYVLDFSDTITQNPHWLRSVVEVRPIGLGHVRWHVFSNADRIPDTIELLKRLNVVHVFVGVETGDETVAQNVLKGRKFSPTLVRDGISKLVDAGMRVTPSFVYGLRGETEASMVNTFQFARELVELAESEEVFASEFIPWPGAPAWNDVRKFFHTDILDIEKLKEIWLREVVGLNPVVVRQYVDATLALAKYPISIQRKGD